MFGLSPDEVRQQQYQQQVLAAQTAANNMQGGDAISAPFDRARQSIATGAGMFAPMVASSMGYQSPQEVQAQKMQDISKDMDLTSVNGLKDAAQRFHAAGMTEQAMTLALAAQKQEAEQAKIALGNAQALKALREPVQKGTATEVGVPNDKSGLWRMKVDPNTGEPIGSKYLSKSDTSTPSIDPKTVDFYSNQSLGGDNSWQVGIARGKVGQALIAAVKDRIPQLAAEQNMAPQDLSTNKGERDSLNKALNSRQQYVGAANQFVGNFNQQMDLVKGLMDKGSATGVPVFNRWIQSGRQKVAGDPDVTALDTAIRGLGREHQRIVTGLTSAAQLHASSALMGDELINKYQSPEQMLSSMGVMYHEANNLKNSGTSEILNLKNQLRNIGKKQVPVDVPISGAIPTVNESGLTNLQKINSTSLEDRLKKYQNK